MEFRVLGPFEVVDEELGVVPLGAAKERALLALLVLHADEVVSSERMIDELWGERPPESAANVLHTYISHLRRTLEPGRRRGVDGLIVTRPPGYLLRLEPGQLDLHRFEELVHGGALHCRPGPGAHDAERGARALARAAAAGVHVRRLRASRDLPDRRAASRGD